MWPFSKSAQPEKIPSTVMVHLRGGGADCVEFTELIADDTWVEFRLVGKLVALYPFNAVQAIIAEELK